MPIGIASDEEFQLELDRLSGKRSSPPAQTEIVGIPSKGRSEGDVNVPDSLRKIIGETSVIEGRQAAIQLATQFGVSKSSVSAYAKGATSTTSYNQPKQGILEHINKSRHRATKRAARTLNAALGSITQEKLDYTDAKDLAVIARNMSAIIKDLEPQSVQEDVSGTRAPQFVIYAPQFKSEQSFEVITVNE